MALLRMTRNSPQEKYIRLLENLGFRNSKSDRGSDKGTCYLITNHQKAGFTSSNVFTGLGYNFNNVMTGDVSFLPSTSNIDNTTKPHNPGTLVNKNGTIYLVGSNGLIGMPDWNTLKSWGYTSADIVPANSADNNLAVVGTLPGRQPQYLTPSTNGQYTPTPTPTPTPTSSTSNGPKITIISAPLSVNVGQQVNFSFSASDPNNIGISGWSGVFDSSNGDISTCGQDGGVRSGNTYTVCHSWGVAGIYNVKISASNNNGIWNSTSFTVNVGNNPTPTPNSSITVTYPTGGETLVAGQTYNITWKSNNVNAVKISLCGTSNYLGYICHPLSFIPDSGISASLGTFSWYVDPNDPYIPGSVKIRVTQIVSNGTTAVYGESGATFTVNTASAQVSYITATKNSAFGDQTVTPNQANVKIGSYVLNAPASEGVKLSSVTLMSNNQNASASFQNVRLINGANAAQFGVTQVSSNGAYSFSGLINIPAGSSLVLDVYADILGSATGSANPATVLSSISAVGVTSNASMQISNQISGQNVTFGTSTAASCSLTAQVVGTHVSTDNTAWGFDVMVNAANPPSGSNGWTANFQGYVPTVTGYGKTIHYGDFFTSYGALQLTVHDQVNSNCATTITVSPPTSTVSATPSLNLSLNSSSPTGQTITAGGTGYTFLIFDLTAGPSSNVSISSMNFGVSGAVGPYVTNLKLFNVSDNSQIYSGSNTTAQTFSPNLVIPAGTTKTLKLVGDISAGATPGSKLLLALANTNITLSSQSAGTSVTGSAWPSDYTHTVAASSIPPSLTVTLDHGVSSIPQTIAVGNNGATDKTVAAYNIVTTGGDVHIKEIKFSVSGGVPITSIKINNISVAVVNNIADVTGLDILVPNGWAGYTIPVYISYGGVGGSTGYPNGNTSYITLEYLKYLDNNGVSNTSCVSSFDVCSVNMSNRVNSPTMTVVNN